MKIDKRQDLETHVTPAMQLSRTTAPLDPRALELRFSSTLAVDSLQASPSSRCFKAGIETISSFAQLNVIIGGSSG